jgi:hypothetical protein
MRMQGSALHQTTSTALTDTPVFHGDLIQGSTQHWAVIIGKQGLIQVLKERRLPKSTNRAGALKEAFSSLSGLLDDFVHRRGG